MIRDKQDKLAHYLLNTLKIVIKKENIKAMKSFLMLLFIIFGGIGSCDSAREAAKLKDVKWELETLNGEKVNLADPENKMFIQFDVAEKRVNGRAACNRFFGNFELDDLKLKFSPMGATRMACPDLQQETRFFQMLEKVDSFNLKDNTLSFLSKGETVATFRKAEENN